MSGAQPGWAASRPAGAGFQPIEEAREPALEEHVDAHVHVRPLAQPRERGQLRQERGERLLLRRHPFLAVHPRVLLRLDLGLRSDAAMPRTYAM